MTWLDGWERSEIPGHSGGSYTGSEPWRLVLHSTEGLSVASAIGAYTSAGVPPTVTIGVAERRKVQHIDTDRSAYAVMNQPGGVETNRWNCLQAEIVMFADQTKAQQYGGLYVGDLTDDDYTFLRGALLELQADKPFTFDGPDFIHYPDSYGNTRYRMSFGEWAAFNGTCGHQHVPENDHGDPGDLDRVRLFAPAAPVPDPPKPVRHRMNPAYISLNGVLHAFVVGADGACYYHVNGTAPDDWRHVGGLWTSGLEVIEDAGSVVIAGRGGDGQLWEMRGLPGGTWSTNAVGGALAQ